MRRSSPATIPARLYRLPWFSRCHASVRRGSVPALMVRLGLGSVYFRLQLVLLIRSPGFSVLVVEDCAAAEPWPGLAEAAPVVVVSVWVEAAAPGGATGAARARGCSGSGGVRRCGYGSGCWRSSGHWCGRARRSRCRYSCGRVFRCRVCCGKIVRVRITCDVYHRRGGQGYRRVVTREKRGRRAIGGPFDHQIPHLQHRDLRAPVVTASTATGAQRQCGEAQGQGVGKMCLFHDGRAAWGVSARKTAGQSGRETERRKKEFTKRHGLVWCAQQTVPSGVQRP